MNLGQFSAGSPSGFPTPNGLFGVAIPDAHRTILVPLFTIKTLTLGRENKVRGKGFLKALPPLDERGKSLMVERD